MRRGLVMGMVCLGLSLGLRVRAIQTPQQPSQVQVSRQFLRALLRAEYGVAYSYLAPEVRQSVRPADFRQLARPVIGRGLRRGTTLELYKLGLRLNESGAGGQSFVAFAWAADSPSARREPPEWLEVTFRDAEARHIFGFALRKRRN